MADLDAPSRSDRRLDVVDAVRGFALSALFLVHMLESYELYWADPRPDWASRAVFLLFMGKCFSLLAIGFGFSFYMLVDRPGRARLGPGRFVWRLAVLALIGGAHALLYRGDMIGVLALLGLPLVIVRRVGSRVLLGLALLCLLQLPLWGVLVAALGDPTAGAYVPRDPGMAAYLHGDLFAVLGANLWLGQVAKWRFMLHAGRITQVLGLYLVGVVLGRSGFFARLDALRRQRHVALLVAMAATLVLVAARSRLVAGLVDAGLPAAAAAMLNLILESWCDLAATAAWGLAICALWQGPARGLLRLLAPVGRATLTLYLVQSLVFVPLFYPFGAGLYARWDGPTRLLVGLAGVAVQLWLARAWFTRYRYGPVEWAWRAATALSTDIPFRRQPAPRATRRGELVFVPAPERGVAPLGS